MVTFSNEKAIKYSWEKEKRRITYVFFNVKIYELFAMFHSIDTVESFNFSRWIEWKKEEEIN